MEIKFIIIITVALFFIALVQLMKIYDLAAKVRGEKSQEKLSRSENLLMANLMLVFMVAFFGFIIWLISKYGSNSCPFGLTTSRLSKRELIVSVVVTKLGYILSYFFYIDILII